MLTNMLLLPQRCKKANLDLQCSLNNLFKKQNQILNQNIFAQVLKQLVGYSAKTNTNINTNTNKCTYRYKHKHKQTHTHIYK